jgi:hypothetical protein
VGNRNAIGAMQHCAFVVTAERFREVEARLKSHGINYIGPIAQLPGLLGIYFYDPNGSSSPASSAGRPMPDGAKPGPGGWNRIHLIVDDIDAEVARLRAEGAPFRNDILEGPGGKAGPAPKTPPATSSNSSNPPPPSPQPDETPRVDVPPVRGSYARARTAPTPQVDRGRRRGSANDHL